MEIIGRSDIEGFMVTPPRNTRLGGYNSPLRGARQRLSSRRLSPIVPLIRHLIDLAATVNQGATGAGLEEGFRFPVI